MIKELPMQNLLQLWEQAGERPYEVLIKEGVYDTFLSYLNSSYIKINEPIFRGTQRHQELKEGDILNYKYSTSWSDNFDNAFRFVEEEEDPVIFSLIPNKKIKGVFNPYNTYGENEFIIYPIVLKVVKRYDFDNYILLELIKL